MFQKVKTEIWFATGFVAIVAMLVLLAFATFAEANPAQYVTPTQTAAATTSPVAMTPGTATSTLYFDTYNSSTGNNYTTNTVELLTQFTAASTLSQLNINVEYANDSTIANCATTPTACDWYQDTGTNFSGYATTTLPVSINQVAQYQWRFASSTVGQGAVSATNNRDTRAMKIIVPTRYVRVIYSCGIGGAACSVWGQIVPSKETR